MRKWKEFDFDRHSGLPIPNDESDQEKRLRIAITGFVYQYFEDLAVDQIRKKTGCTQEKIQPPAFTPKTHAFCQMIAFILYRDTATRNKERRTAFCQQQKQQEHQHAQQQPQQPQQQRERVRSLVHNDFEPYKEEMLAFLKGFKYEYMFEITDNFKGLDDETGDEKSLRAAFTRDVHDYFERAVRDLTRQEGRHTRMQVRHAFPPLMMYAFCQAVAFRLYMATRNKNRIFLQRWHRRHMPCRTRVVSVRYFQRAKRLHESRERSIIALIDDLKRL